MQTKYLSLLTICAVLAISADMEARGTKAPPAKKPATTAKTQTQAAAAAATPTLAQQEAALLAQQQIAGVRDAALAGQVDAQAQAALANQTTDGTTPDTDNN